MRTVLFLLIRMLIVHALQQCILHTECAVHQRCHLGLCECDIGFVAEAGTCLRRCTHKTASGCLASGCKWEHETCTDRSTTARALQFTDDDILDDDDDDDDNEGGTALAWIGAIMIVLALIGIVWYIFYLRHLRKNKGEQDGNAQPKAPIWRSQRPKKPHNPAGMEIAAIRDLTTSEPVHKDPASPGSAGSSFARRPNVSQASVLRKETQGKKLQIGKRPMKDRKEERLRT